jgi:6-pyruvoyltetrahydropterin/6-carboxytetrahydropterin synthase
VPPIVYITRRFEFAAAHRVYNPAWTDEQNAAFYGPCSNPAGHGHNYTLEVTIGGTPDPETGYLIDIKQLRKIVERVLISELDHKHLNYDVPFLEGQIPSTENLIVAAWQKLENAFPSHVRLFRLRLWETSNNYFEYYGEKID